MSLPKNEAWFAAKRYGYGWGFPKRRQGWLVLFGYLIIAIISSLVFVPKHMVLFLICLIVISLLLVAICMWKGEEPRWRWGDEN